MLSIARSLPFRLASVLAPDHAVAVSYRRPTCILLSQQHSAYTAARRSLTVFRFGQGSPQRQYSCLSLTDGGPAFTMTSARTWELRWTGKLTFMTTE
jgi:hypothetical protein